MTNELFEKMCDLDYEKLEDLLKDGITQLKIKAYAEGYGQGKFDAEMEYRYEPTEDITYWSPQNRRDRIVEQAKKDVAERQPKTPVFPPYEFIINREKRTVVALVRGIMTNKVVSKGIAKCAPDDCFNVHIGKAIALRRALGLEVPAEYMNAPRPTEVRVGDKVKYYRATEGWIIREITNSNAEAMYDTEKAHIESRVAKEGIVIDDSRDGGESQ